MTARRPDAAGLAAATQAVLAGQPVVVPTDTVYGLAVRAGDAPAIDQIFALKRRPAERAIAVLVSGIAQASELANITPSERLLAEAFWPGALTLVVERRADADPTIGRPDGTVGLRCPANPFVRDLAEAVGPLATTSANLSGQTTPPEAIDAAEQLDGDVQVVIDGGTVGGDASTVAQVQPDGSIVIFREGPITLADMAEVLVHST